MEEKKRRFESIDGLRALSCLAIIIMHIKANTEYAIDSSFYWTVIPSLSWLVLLFIMISGFSMCAGYLDRFLTGNVNLEQFYVRRYSKILPFFSALLLIALVVEHSLATVYEASIELTLLYGFLPNNNMSTLGVCWTLGVIFVFYLVFPAFSVLMKSKKRAWLALLAAIWVVFVCFEYFFDSYYVTETFTPRHNFLYSIPLFIAGGLIYLYREELSKLMKKLRFVVLAVCIAFTVAWYFIPDFDNQFIFYIKTFAVFTLWLSYAVGVESKFLQCKVFKYLSSISMEMYLAQMIIFRVIEKAKLLYLLGDGVVGFIFACVVEVALLIGFIEAYKRCYSFAKKLIGGRG